MEATTIRTTKLLQKESAQHAKAAKGRKRGRVEKQIKQECVVGVIQKFFGDKRYSLKLETGKEVTGRVVGAVRESFNGDEEVLVEYFPQLDDGGLGKEVYVTILGPYDPANKPTGLRKLVLPKGKDAPLGLTGLGFAIDEIVSKPPLDIDAL